MGLIEHMLGLVYVNIFESVNQEIMEISLESPRLERRFGPKL